MMTTRFYNRKSGIAALFVVVVLGAASLVLALSATFLGLGEIEEAFEATRGGKAFSIADGCLEETLERIRENPNYDGSSPPTFTDGSCTIIVTPSGLQRAVAVEGAFGDYTKKLQATVTLTIDGATGVVLYMNMDNWSEPTL